MSLRKTLPGMCLALPLLGGCADIMGFQDGRPFPPEDASVPVDASAEADTTSNPTTLDAGADSEEGGQAEGGDGGCPSGFLRCGSLCVPPTGCCDPTQCQASESCVNNACACNEGKKRCGGQCIPSNDCCDFHDCPTGGACQNGTCACPAGSHQCGNACASNLDPTTCATSCSACTPPTGGTATCDGTKCGVSCPTGQVLCAGVCIPLQNACTNQCPVMTHDCAGACPANSSVNSCGASCTPCAVPSNGQATCDGTSCGVQCNATFKQCGTQCIPSSGCCMTAECPTNSTCSGNQCQCNSGFKLCNGACIPTSACCTDGECQANAGCVSNQCQCKATFKDCNGTCIPLAGCCTTPDCTNGYQCSGNTCQCQLPDIVCQGSCLNGGTDTNNCGACGHVCPLGCAQSQCKCATPELNALPNPGFDVDFSGWTWFPVVPGAASSWTTDDAVGCPTSGSMRFKTMATAIGNDGSWTNNMDLPLPGSTPATSYTAGLRARRIGSVTGLVSFEIRYDNGSVTTQGVDVGPDWTVYTTPPSAMGATRAWFIFYVTKTGPGSIPFEVEVDMAYLAPTPGTGWR